MIPHTGGDRERGCGTRLPGKCGESSYVVERKGGGWAPKMRGQAGEKDRQAEIAVGFWKWEEIESQSSEHFRTKGGMKQDRCAKMGFQGEEREC